MRMICFMENWQTESDTSRKMRKELRVCDKAIEEMRNQEREEVTREFVVRMIRDGETSVEKMARYSGLSLDEVKEIVKQEAVLAWL